MKLTGLVEGGRGVLGRLERAKDVDGDDSANEVRDVSSSYSEPGPCDDADVGVEVIFQSWS